ncbi:MAG: hypothetical protein K5871_07695 [Lachnospiraceae bacterium]|nr:hypothetical protein [Lachnospiraceae bacterium]
MMISGLPGNFILSSKKLYKTLAVKNDKIALKKLLREDADFTDVDEETLRVISVVTDRPAIWEKREKSKIRKGEYNMCLAFDQIEEDARIVGREEGYNIAKTEFQEEIDKQAREIAFLRSLLDDKNKNKQSEAN